MAKPKKLNFEPIPRKDARGKIVGVYKTLDKVVTEWHPHLRKANILLAWHKGWKVDKDCHLTLAKVKKAADLDRAYHDVDFFILLNKPVWESVDFTAEWETAIIDHECCHCRAVFDEDGNPKRDTKGKIVYRVAKHDIEEFDAVVERHGIYRKAVDDFIKAALEKGANPLFAVIRDNEEPTVDRTPVEDDEEENEEEEEGEMAEAS